jgi:outer membrane receptor protein involved in Fe transport
MKVSIEEGHLVALDEIDKFVDGAAVKRVGDITFGICRQHLDRVILIPEGKVCTTILQSFRADYEHPFGKVGKLQLGTKFTWTSSNNDLRYDTLGAGQWVYDPSRSNRFLYHETIVAGYAQVSREFGLVQIEAGLRIENTNTRGNSLTLDNVVDRSYFRWLPSLKLQRKLSETNTLSASFSRKMRRPAFWELNPFTLYIDPYTFTEGNPFLLPVTNNTADITFNHGDLSFSVNYTIDKGVFVQVPIQNDATNVLRYTRINLDMPPRPLPSPSGGKPSITPC